MNHQTYSNTFKDISSLGQIWKQEEQWKELLAQEIVGLQKTIAFKDEKLSEQTVQLEEIKKSFIYNYDLLKARDEELAKFEVALDKLKGVLMKRDAEISELRVSMDQLREDLRKSGESALDWKSRFESESQLAVARESEARKASNAAISKLAESEAAERRRLHAQLTRLEADLEAERLRATSDLETALAEATRNAADVSGEAARARIALETRAQAAEDSAVRSRQESRRFAQELHSANDAVYKLESDVADRGQKVAASEGRVRELLESVDHLEKEKAALELKVSRLENREEAKRKAAEKTIENLRESDSTNKKLLLSVQRTLDAAKEDTTAETRRLLFAVSKAEKCAEEALSARDAIEADRQLAVRTAKHLESENSRLRNDLAQALSQGPPMPNQSAEGAAAANCNVAHLEGSVRDLVGQVAALHISCDRLEEENRCLRKRAPMASVEKEMLDLRGQLGEALRQVRALTDERNRLLQLSNKMRARQMREDVTKKQPVVPSRGSDCVAPDVRPKRSPHGDGGGGGSSTSSCALRSQSSAVEVIPAVLTYAGPLPTSVMRNNANVCRFGFSRQCRSKR